MSDDIDEFTADQQPKAVVTNEKLQEVVAIGERMVHLQQVVQNLEAMLEQKKKDLMRIKNEELPTAMDEIEMTMFRLNNGVIIEVEPVLIVSTTKDKMDEFAAWLQANEHGGLVKRQLSVQISREEDPAKAEPIITAIKAAGYEVIDEKTIHWATLRKWGREMEEEGELILVPEGLINVYRARVATAKI